MSQKHIALVALGVVGVGLLSVFVYQQFRVSVPVSEWSPMMESPKTTAVDRTQQAPVPETIDDVLLSIQEEASSDLSALDAEEAGEIEDIEADSDSINNLGTSYDENSL